MAYNMVSRTHPSYVHPQVIKQGWLVKQPVSGFFGSKKLRWIVLFDNRIEWRQMLGVSTSAIRSVTLGSIFLGPHSEVFVDDRDHGRVIVETEGRELILHPNINEHGSLQELAEWAGAISEQIQRMRQPINWQSASTQYFVRSPRVHTRPVYIEQHERRGYGTGGLALGVAGGVVAGAKLANVVDDDLLLRSVVTHRRLMA